MLEVIIVNLPSEIVGKNELLCNYVPNVASQAFIKLIQYEYKRYNILKPSEALPNYMKGPHLFLRN